MAEQLGSGWRGPGEPPPTLVLRGALDRDSLHLAVVRLPTAPQRLAWLADQLGELPGSGIVYTLTVAGAHDVAEFLRDRGYTAEAYTGQTDPAQRLAIEDDLLANKLKAVVATSALGMGYDKPDLGFIVHLGAPQSPVAYYQQIGRAGRGVERAEVILLPATEDRDIWAYFASLAFPPERDVRTALAALAAAGGAQSLAALETHVDLARGRLETMLKVLDVDGAVRRVPGGWTVTGQPWVYDKQRYDRVAAERSREQQAMLGLRKYRRLPDGVSAPGTRRPAGGALRAVRQLHRRGPHGRGEHPHRELRQGTAAAPGRDGRRRGGSGPPGWPRSVSTLPAGSRPMSRPSRGGPSAGLTDIGWGSPLRKVLAEGAPDEPVPGDLFDAVLAVLADLGLGRAPGRGGDPAVPVAAPPDHRARPADRGGRKAQLPGQPGIPERRTAGAPVQQRPAVGRAVAHPGRAWMTWAPQLAGFGQPVLLVDDRIGTGWTMTVGAKLLRECDAPAVLPFALAVST